MRVISIHSHKGGAGKTTLALMIAKAQAMSGQKVCAVDLDFIGSGFEHLLDVPRPDKFLEDYLTKAPGSPKLPKLEEMITSYSDEETGAFKVDLVFNLAGSMLNNKEPERRKLLALIGLEPDQNIAVRAVMLFLSGLKEAGYDTVLLDCHPGLAYLSRSLLHYGKKDGFEENAFIFVTTSSRAHFYGLVNELNTLAGDEYKRLFSPSQSVLCLNRSSSALFGNWKELVAFMREETVQRAEARSRISTFEKICREGGGVNYLCLAESDTISEWGNIGGKGEIVLPDQESITCTNTPLCQSVLMGLMGD